MLTKALDLLVDKFIILLFHNFDFCSRVLKFFGP